MEKKPKRLHSWEDPEFVAKSRKRDKANPLSCLVIQVAAAICVTDEDLVWMAAEGYTPGRVIPPSWRR